MHRVLSPHALVPAAWLALSLAACGDRERSAAIQDTVPAGPETGMVADSMPADTAGTSAPLTDANIVALLDEANKADSAAGALAVTKATSKEVKDFAKLMMSEHHALREAGQQLAKKLNVTPAPPATDPVKPLAEGETKALESTPKVRSSIRSTSSRRSPPTRRCSTWRRTPTGRRRTSSSRR